MYHADAIIYECHDSHDIFVKNSTPLFNQENKNKSNDRIATLTTEIDFLKSQYTTLQETANASSDELSHVTHEKNQLALRLENVERTFRSQLQEAGFAAENKLSSVREGLEEERNTIRNNLKDVLSKSLSRENESASRIKELEDDLELTK